MSDEAERHRGPLLGEPAPDFETVIAGHAINLKDFKGKWVIVYSHPEDLLPVFKTRTMNYVLCKRRTKVIALGDGQTAGIDAGKNLIKKYILKHNLTIVDDSGRGIAESYGLSPKTPDGLEEEKGVFIVDPRGILRVKLYLPLTAERNFYENLTLIDTLQAADRQEMLRTDKGAWRRRLDVVIRQKVVTGEGSSG
jgi:peroxiredoxin (alkyl hydroperoxide reductase subunit C)